MGHLLPGLNAVALRQGHDNSRKVQKRGALPATALGPGVAGVDKYLQALVPQVALDKDDDPRVVGSAFDLGFQELRQPLGIVRPDPDDAPSSPNHHARPGGKAPDPARPRAPVDSPAVQDHCEGGRRIRAGTFSWPVGAAMLGTSSDATHDNAAPLRKQVCDPPLKKRRPS